MKRKEILKKYAKGNKDAKLKVISLGMGVQSTALYLMSSMGYKIPRADVSIFSDPQAEHYKTYEMLDWLINWQKENDGIPIIINRNYNIFEDQMKTPTGARVPSIPAHTEESGILMRQCTETYKINPVKESIRKIHKLEPKKRMKETELWLGISLDEIQRMKESRMYNIKYFYPLIYHSMTRNDCIDFFKHNNFPIPIKSSCVFCPYHSDKYWKDMQKENGDAWNISVKVDKAIRVKKNLDQKLYLSSRCKPLDEIDFDDGQLEMFEGYDCEGYCGL